MHQIVSTASPYLFQILLDCELPYRESDLVIFNKNTKQGIAVYGHTPNALIIANKTYLHWSSLEKLIVELDCGKVALCTD